MTKSQEAALAKIHKLVERELYSDKYEIKRFETRDNDSFISLIVEYGLIGDEGTLAEVFGRDSAHLFIGKRGGITYPMHNKSGKFYTKKFEGYSILQAVCDQRK